MLPQLAGLGHSTTAKRYDIAHLAEASPCLADPLLRQPGQSLEQLMGSGLDAAKTVSSLNLLKPP